MCEGITMEANRVIETQDLVKVYGKYAAVNRVSFSLNKGDIYGLIGKNGAGKSTLLKMIMGLTPVNSGEISIDQSQNHLELLKSRHRVGFMMEPGFFGYLSARQNLEYFRLIKGIADKSVVDEALKLVDMDQVKKPFKAYSMGMKQRLAVANALMGRPEIIILDEPINGLDPEGIADFRKLIMSLNKDYGITFVISSHILTELSLMATRFGFIDKGVLLSEMSQQELHEVNQKSLRIKVDNVDLATELIESVLESKNYQVNDKGEIILFDFVQSPEVVAKVLVEKGIALYQLSANETTLEEYFLNLVGDHQNV